MLTRFPPALLHSRARWQSSKPQGDPPVAVGVVAASTEVPSAWWPVRVPPSWLLAYKSVQKCYILHHWRESCPALSTDIRRLMEAPVALSV